MSSGSVKRETSPPEKEAVNVQRGLALRMEADFPVAAAAILSARPRLEDGELVLSFPDRFKEARREAHKLSRAMKYYTDHPVRIERVRGS
jgi:hypothetical protein